VERADVGYRVSLSDGSAVEADVVISAVGLRPRTALARDAGLAVNRGIVVDSFLRASAESVFALGDCAEIEGRVRPYVLPIMHAARGLARTLAGEPTEIRFPPMPVVVKTPACPLVVNPVEAGEPGAWSVVEREGGVKMVFTDGGDRVRGFALTGSRAAERGAMTRLLAA
jgi:rubredoxin-NAD+ reductase